MRRRRSTGSLFPIINPKFSVSLSCALIVVFVLPLAACDRGSDSEAESTGSGMEAAESAATIQGSGQAEADDAEATGEVGEAMSSGIEGRAVIGPTCPAQRVDQPCPERPYPTTLTIVDPSTGEVVAKAECDEEGYFHVNLPPGSYRLEPPGARVLTAPRAKPMTVEVEAGRYTEIVIRFDSGIR